MLNFSPAGFIDPFELLCSLKGRLHLFTGTGLRVLHLRAPRKSEPNAYIDLRDLTRWPEAQAVLDQVAETAEKRAGHAVELGRAYLEMLDAGAATAPRKIAGDYAARHARVVVGLRCNPGSYLWCPPDQVVLTSGQAVLTSPALYHGALNAGETARIHLIIDVRQATSTLRDAVNDLRAVPGSGWKEIPDPLDELAEIRGAKPRSPEHTHDAEGPGHLL